MFEVKLDGLDQLLKKFDSFGTQIAKLPQAVPAELEAWQREDMHRKYPNQETQTKDNVTTAETKIWPRSQLDEGHHPVPKGRQGPKRARPNRQGPTQHRAKGAGKPPPSNRPILRDELEHKLVDRMDVVVTEAMKWP